ncbi:MAG TPA: hypothetical protein VIE89_19480 [Candidatus Binatia bacterium]
MDRVITSSRNLTQLRNEPTALRNRKEFQRSQLTELASTDFESCAKESFEIATKIAYRNDGQIGIPKAGAMGLHDGGGSSPASCGMLPVRAGLRIERMILSGYPLADMVTRILKL